MISNEQYIEAVAHITLVGEAVFTDESTELVQEYEHWLYAQGDSIVASIEARAEERYLELAYQHQEFIRLALEEGVVK